MAVPVSVPLEGVPDEARWPVDRLLTSSAAILKPTDVVGVVSLAAVAVLAVVVVVLAVFDMFSSDCPKKGDNNNNKHLFGSILL